MLLYVSQIPTVNYVTPFVHVGRCESCSAPCAGGSGVLLGWRKTGPTGTTTKDRRLTKTGRPDKSSKYIRSSGANRRRSRPQEGNP